MKYARGVYFLKFQSFQFNRIEKVILNYVVCINYTMNRIKKCFFEGVKIFKKKSFEYRKIIHLLAYK